MELMGEVCLHLGANAAAIEVQSFAGQAAPDFKALYFGSPPP